MNPVAGTLWRRKLSGRLWHVERVADGLVEISFVGRRTDCTATEKAAERELLPEASFRQSFEPVCPQCGGAGHLDSGGVTPWGTGIDIPCPSCHPDPNKDCGCDVCAVWGQGQCKSDDTIDPMDI